MDDQILTAKEAAQLLRLSLDTLYAGVNRGEIPHKRVGRKLLFSRKALSAWLVSGGKSATQLAKHLLHEVIAANDDEDFDADTSVVSLRAKRA